MTDAIAQGPGGAAAAPAVGAPPPRERSILRIVLVAGLIVLAGSLISIVCTAISAWLTGSGYVVTPGRPL